MDGWSGICPARGGLSFAEIGAWIGLVANKK